MKNEVISDYLTTVKRYEDSRGLRSELYNYAVKRGSRYIKVVASDVAGDSLRAVAFIDQLTGSVFTAASWSKPARTRIA